MHSSTHYSLKDLQFDRDDLEVINNVKHNCVKYAVLRNGSLNISKSDIESFIVWAKEFLDEKKLLLCKNADYLSPLLTNTGLDIRLATEDSLSDLDYYLKRLKYDINNP